MENDPALIRQQMQETRSSLTEKLEELEQHVTSTVKETASAVSQSVQNVKENLEGTAESVRESLDIRRHVQRHPWAMTGGSVVAGFLAGRMLDRGAEGHGTRWRDEPPGLIDVAAMDDRSPVSRWNHVSEEIPDSSPPPAPPRPSKLSQLQETFEPEIAALRGLAIGALFGVVRDLIVRSVPEQISDQLTEVTDRFTVKLGGKPLKGPVLPERTADPVTAR